MDDDRDTNFTSDEEGLLEDELEGDEKY